jgi:hypothetical protein
MDTIETKKMSQKWATHLCIYPIKRRYCVLVIRTSRKWTWFGMIIIIQMSISLSSILAINLLDINLCHNSKNNCCHNNFKILELFCQHILLYIMGIFPFDYYCDKNCHNNCYLLDFLIYVHSSNSNNINGRPTCMLPPRHWHLNIFANVVES